MPKISELAAATTLPATALLPIVTGGATVRATGAHIPNALGACTLEQFGAVGDGVTSDQAAFEAARAAIAAGTYGTLVLGAKRYLVSGTVSPTTSPWPFGFAVIGQGPASVLVTTTAGGVFICRSADAAVRAKTTLFANFSVEGTGQNNQNAIETGYLGADGSSYVSVMNVQGKTLDRLVSVYAGADIGHGPRIVGCSAYSCNVGFYMSDQATLRACEAVACTTGLRVGAGNVDFDGAITGCTTGVDVVAGGNDAHGVVRGQFNHNTKPIQVGAISNGQSFVGCHVYEGEIEIVANTGAVSFTGCTFDATTYDLRGRAKFSGCKVATAYFTTYSEDANSAIDWADTRHEDGTVPTWIGQRTHVRYTFPGDANQTLTKQVSEAAYLDIQAGVVSVARTLTLAKPPNQGNAIQVKNRTAVSINIAWSTGSGVAVTSGSSATVGADGTNAVLL
jgi:hypothetical protein